jgi:hypothetical protein
VLTEDDPIDPSPPAVMRALLESLLHLEQAVLGIEWGEGLVLRYGGLYARRPRSAGPRTRRWQEPVR